MRMAQRVSRSRGSGSTQRILGALGVIADLPLFLLGSVDLFHDVVNQNMIFGRGGGKTHPGSKSPRANNISPFLRLYIYCMAQRPKLTPVQVLERPQNRLEKRMEALQRIKLDGYAVVISKLETELDYLRRAMRYLESDRN